MNDEARMTNDERRPKLEARNSSFFRHSSFVIRHFSTRHFAPTNHQLRWLLLIVTGLFSLSGASCPHFLQQYTNPMPRLLPASPPPTLEQVIDVVNRNSSQIQSFSTSRASISGPGFPSLSTSIAFERPQQFRLRATSFVGAEFDLGSNDQLFWFWLKRSQPPAIYYCRHDQFAASQARQMTPFEPRWLIEALGVVEFDRSLPQQLTVLPNDRLRIDTIRNTPEGPTMKVTILDGSQGWILEQHLYDAHRRPVAHSIASGHRQDPLSGLVMPTVVQIDSPAAQLSLRIDLGNVEINRLSGDRAALWSMPSIPGVPVVDIGDPNFRFSPPAGVPTVRRPAPANRPREAW
ncbi:MAG: hypothetical protein WCB27_19500 [Thermoguttaceae bacterium]|jgi:hypothetical protein